MKRVICILVTFAVLISCMIVSVSAAEDNYSPTINVLDFSTANDSGNNMVLLNPGSYASFALPSTYTVYYVEALVRFTSGNIPSNAYVNVGGINYRLYMAQVSGNTYRIYGNLAKTDAFLRFNFDFTSSENVIFFDVRCSIGADAYEIDGYLEINSVDLYDTIHYVPTDTINYRGWTPSVNETFSLYGWTTEWRKFDYLDFIFLVDAGPIQSVSCDIDGMNVPITVQEIYSTSIYDNQYFIAVRLDLTSIKRSLSGNPAINILIGQYTGETCYAAVVSIIGYVSVNVNLLSYWFRNLNSWIQNLSSSITSTITTWGQNIVAAFSPDDNGSADQFQESVSSQAGELSGIADAMGSLDKPDPDSLNVNLDSFAVNANISGVGSVLAVPMRNDIILQVLIMTFTFALVGYALFGKR